MKLTIELSKAQLAALKEHVRVTAPDPGDVDLEQWAVAACVKGLNELRDTYRIDAIAPVAFIRRFSPDTYARILKHAEASEPLKQALDALEAARYVWLGSDLVISMVQGFVTGGLMEQSEADKVLAFGAL